MEDKLLQNFFYVNTRLLKMKTFVLSDKAFHVLFPVLPLCGFFMSVWELNKGNFIIFHIVTLIVGLLVSFLLMTVSMYYFRGIEVFKEFKRHKSNQNLRTGNSKSNISIKKPHEDISTLVSARQDLINKYFSGIRRIGLVNDDVTISDFKNLIENFLSDFDSDCTFKLEVNANQTNGFVRKLILPLLENIDKNKIVTLERIVSFLHFKKNSGYHKVKLSTTKNKKRMFLTKEQTFLYDELKK